MLKIEITFPLTPDEQKALAAILATQGAEHVTMEAKQAEPTPNEKMHAAVEKAATAPAKRAGAKKAAPAPVVEEEPEEETTSDIQEKALEMASELVKAKKAAIVREALEAVSGTKASELDEEQAQAFVDFLNHYPAEEEEAKPAPAKKAAAKKAAAKPKPAEDDDLLGDGGRQYTPEHAMEVASALVKDKKAALVRGALDVAGASKVTELDGEDQIKTFLEAIDEALAAEE